MKLLIARFLFFPLACCHWMEIFQEFTGSVSLESHYTDTCVFPVCQKSNIFNRYCTSNGGSLRTLGQFATQVKRDYALYYQRYKLESGEVSPRVFAIEKCSSLNISVGKKRFVRDSENNQLPVFVKEYGNSIEFNREKDALLNINHPNVISPICFGSKMIVLPKLDGGHLLEASPSNTFNLYVNILSKFSFQLASALRAVHDAGFLHGDIKIANIMVHGPDRNYWQEDADPDLYDLVLIDFGWSTRLNRLIPSETTGFHDSVKMSQATAGSPAYYSPEQEASLFISRASEWWQVGLVLSLVTIQYGNVEYNDSHSLFHACSALIDEKLHIVKLRNNNAIAWLRETFPAFFNFVAILMSPKPFLRDFSFDEDSFNRLLRHEFLNQYLNKYDDNVGFFINI